MQIGPLPDGVEPGFYCATHWIRLPCMDLWE
jgi:hypothetical protein